MGKKDKEQVIKELSRNSVYAGRLVADINFKNIALERGNAYLKDI